MNNFPVFKLITVLAVMLLFCSAAWCQNISGKPNPATPLWKQLDSMSGSDKQNARVQLEGPNDPTPALLREFTVIESLWNAGIYGKAIERLRVLEKSFGPGLAAGIGWIEPKSISGLDFGTDVQIGSRVSAEKTDLDFHEDTGNLFTPILLRNNYSNHRWSMNFSSDGGSTWLETFVWTTSLGEVEDLGASVVDDYCYVAYVPVTDAQGSHSDGRIRRFFASDGSEDSVFHAQIVFDLGVDIRKVALVSNADSKNNVLYYFALLNDSRIVFYWAYHAATPSWNDYPTGITNAQWGLDAAYNEGYSDRHLAVSFLSTSGMVRAALLGQSGWRYLSFDTGFNSAVAAYDDHIIVAFEHDNGTDDTIMYYITHDGGNTWYAGFIADTGFNYCPDVTARRGGGISVTWNEEAGGFDRCWYRKRSYSTADWSAPVSVNEFDVISRAPMSIEWVPSAGHNYGISWIAAGMIAMFDRTDWGAQSFTLEVSPDPLVSNANATFTVSYGDPNTLTYLGYSLTGPGSFYVPMLDVTMDIANPVQGGSAITTDGSGNGSWNLFVPSNAAGRNIWLQAVQYQNKTDVVSTSVQ